MPHFLREALFRALANSTHKTVHCGALRVMDLEREESRRVVLSLGLWSPRKEVYDLDSTGIKI